MNKFVIKFIIIVFCLMLILVPAAGTGDTRTEGCETESLEECETESVSYCVDEDDDEPAPEEAQVSSEGKFRVGPVVKLRPVNDVIDSGDDGLIEMYMDNPTINEVNLSVDVRVSVPAGIHVNGEGFGQAAAAGTVYGTFTVPPGQARTVYLNVKADKVGTFTLHLTGLYYPENNKDSYYPISLTHPFVVNEVSEDIEEVPEPTDGEGDHNGGKGTGTQAETVPGPGVVCALLAFAGVAFFRTRRKS
ncbi:MAG: hypothetical protein AB3K77_00610 [Methanosarcinaceae archaeon]